MDKENNKRVSILVCFAGGNQRIEIIPKKCVTDKAAKTFAYKTKHKVGDKTYMVSIKSINGTEGAKANVVVTNVSGKQTFAERQNVDVRFHRYLFG